MFYARFLSILTLLSWAICANATITSDTVIYETPFLNGVDRTAESKFSDAVSVKDFGALGDGSTDDTDAIQAAIDASGGVYFPAGTYIVTEALRLKSFTFLCGDGRNSAIEAETGTFDIIDIDGSSTAYRQHVIVRNLIIRGTSSHNGIRTRHTEFLTIRDNVFAGLNNAIIMSENASETDIKPTIKNNLFYFCDSGIYGGATRVADAVVSHNYIQNCDQGIRFDYLDGGDISFNKIFTDAAPIYTVENNGIVLLGPIYVKVVGNDIFECKGYGMQLNNPRRCSFDKNTIVGTGSVSNKPAIYIYNTYSAATEDICEFTFNKIINPYGTGIECRSVDNFDFLYNEILGANQDDGPYDSITFYESDNCRLTGNRIDGASLARYWLLTTSSSVEINNNIITNHQSNIIYSISSTVKDLNNNNIMIKTTSTTNITADVDVVIGDVLTQSIYMNLPSASKLPGKRLMFIKSDASIYSLILDPAGVQTINGQLTMNVNTQYQAVKIISDGSQWITF